MDSTIPSSAPPRGPASADPSAAGAPGVETTLPPFSPAEEALITVLLKRGLLTTEQVRTAQVYSQERNRDLRQAILELNLITPDLLNQIKVAHAASRPQIRLFARNLLQGRDKLHAAELPVTDPAVDLPRLMLLWAYGDGSLGYRVQEIPEAAWIERVEFGIGFRNFLICKH